MTYLKSQTYLKGTEVLIALGLALAAHYVLLALTLN